MGQEIERKFLVVGEGWRTGQRTTIRQGYLSVEVERTVRVRTKEEHAAANAHAYLTIKGKTEGTARAEYEYEIPLADANELLDHLCLRSLIEKDRYTLDYEGMTWEVDEFFGENQGLVLAEIELEETDQSFANPPWLGEEVSHDARYFNASLTQHPYTAW
ncbi:MAG: CYTH domain-containing protein [Caldilineaceae bacterium]|nr:CYTH domain-containing protein [Caldilineaceae bacterium]MCB0124761.1 CYTH domain-containing protein [Caldilineaceae bacterium]